MSEAMRLKAKIRNIAKQKNIPAQVILQNDVESIPQAIFLCKGDYLRTNYGVHKDFAQSFTSILSTAGMMCGLASRIGSTALKRSSTAG